MGSPAGHRLEFDEIADLVHEYNNTVIQNQIDFKEYKDKDRTTSPASTTMRPRISSTAWNTWTRTRRALPAA